ncbi:MAG: UvrD-helicase domain-containing protein [Chloroflexi bacterium]|nr:UvrD-helicase domain-containing protein [Chloroflexota bacterium]
MEPVWLAELNPQQIEAVTAPPGPIVVMAGPGAGKTRVLTYRVAYILTQQWARPWEVLAVTFTNKAAREMHERLVELLGPTRSEGLWVSTFHAFAAHLLRREARHLDLPFNQHFAIADQEDQLRILTSILKNELNVDIKRYYPATIHSAIDRLKRAGVFPEQAPRTSAWDQVIAEAYARYEQALRDSNLLDFNDLLVWAVRVLEDFPHVLDQYQTRYKHILVDEFQDTNYLQYRLVRLLAQSHRRIFVVGDMDQAIYRWRGADYRNLARLEADFPDARVILLEENYRSTQEILDVAMAILAAGSPRYRKRLVARRGHGPKAVLKQVFSEREQAEFVVRMAVALARERGIPLEDIAVMYRTNAQSRLLEEALMRYQLPYRLVGALRFYGRREIKDLVAYLRVVFNPDDRPSLERIVNVPPRGIGPRTWARWVELAQSRGRSPGAALLDLAQDPEPWRKALPPRAFRVLSSLAQRLYRWHLLREELTPRQMLDRIVDEINYRAYLRNMGDEDEQRWENVQELRRLAADFDQAGLAAFLERLALVSDQDTLTQGEGLTLLTMHAAKGLEFRVVFLVGLVEQLLPHYRSMDDPEALAEERRLLYVGITRAKDLLYMLVPQYRVTYAGYEPAEPSRFLHALSPDLVDGDWARIFPERAGEADRGAREPAWKPTFLRRERSGTNGSKPRQRRRFRVGDRVIHPRWGEGVVVEVDHADGDEIIGVQFPDQDDLRYFLADFVQKLD